MDPITETIVWGVVWFFGGGIGSILIYFLVVGLGLLLTVATEKEWIAGMSILAAWLLTIPWSIFVLIQVIIHIVNLVQLIIA